MELVLGTLAVGLAAVTLITSVTSLNINSKREMQIVEAPAPVTEIVTDDNYNAAGSKIEYDGTGIEYAIRVAEDCFELTELSKEEVLHFYQTAENGWINENSIRHLNEEVRNILEDMELYFEYRDVKDHMILDYTNNYIWLTADVMEVSGIVAKDVLNSSGLYSTILYRDDSLVVYDSYANDSYSHHCSFAALFNDHYVITGQVDWSGAIEYHATESLSRLARFFESFGVANPVDIVDTRK